MWYESVVVGVGEEGSLMMVHFLGWDSKWDEVIKMDSNRLAPLHEYTKDWRPAVIAGSKVEVSDGRRGGEAFLILLPLASLWYHSSM